MSPHLRLERASLANWAKLAISFLYYTKEKSLEQCRKDFIL